MLDTRPDIIYVVSLISRYLANSLFNILKYDYSNLSIPSRYNILRIYI